MNVQRVSVWELTGKNVACSACVALSNQIPRSLKKHYKYNGFVLVLKLAVEPKSTLLALLSVYRGLWDRSWKYNNVISSHAVKAQC